MDIVRLRERLEESKTRRDKVKGTLESLYEQLKESFGAKTLEEARKKLKALKKKAESLRDSLDAGLEELETKYEL
jgi:uncharacterized phage infection (PIP) family protein YhgE